MFSVSKVFVLSLVTCLSFAAQDQCSHKHGPEDTVIVTDKNDGGEVSVAKGGTLVLRLEATPGTGYAWQIVRSDPDYLKTQGDPVFEQPESDQPGGTEHQVFRFTAQASGSTVLKLQYARGWEKGVAPSKTFSLKVTIH